VGIVVQDNSPISGQPGVDLGAVGARRKSVEHCRDAVLRRWAATFQPVPAVRDDDRAARTGRASQHVAHPADIAALRARCDMSDQRDLDERTEQTEAAEPIDSTEQMEPTLPMERTDPTLPMDRTEPFEAIERNDPCDQIDQREVRGAGAVMRT
jgi:hypothetical protein